VGHYCCTHPCCISQYRCMLRFYSSFSPAGITILLSRAPPLPPSQVPPPPPSVLACTLTLLSHLLACCFFPRVFSPLLPSVSFHLLRLAGLVTPAIQRVFSPGCPCPPSTMPPCPPRRCCTVIGTSAEGTEARGNHGAGIFFLLSSAHNLVGGPGPNMRNIISGNLANALLVLGFANKVQGNFIGTDITGTKVV